MAFNPFEMSTGRVTGRVRIKEAWFQHDPEMGQKQGDELYLKLLVTTPDEPEHDDRTLNLKVSNDAWTTRDKGKTAVRQDDKEDTFNANSAAGIFVTSVMLHGGADDVMARYEAEGIEPRQAAWYTGMEFQIGYLEFPGGTRGDGETFQGYNRMIVAGPETINGQAMDEGTENGWIGWASTQSAPAPAKGTAESVSKGEANASGTAPAAAEKGAPVEKGAPAEKGGGTDGGIDPTLLAELDAIADQVGKHDEFMEKAIAHVGPDNLTDALRAAIQDGDSPDSIWQRAVDRWKQSQGQ